MVNSVLGPIDPSDLGFTLMHEHIVCKNSSMDQAFPDWFNRQDTLSNAISELRARASGYKSGIPQLDILLDEGVESGKLVI